MHFPLHINWTNKHILNYSKLIACNIFYSNQIKVLSKTRVLNNLEDGALLWSVLFFYVYVDYETIVIWEAKLFIPQTLILIINGNF